MIKQTSDVDDRGFSKVVEVTADSFVVPRQNASEYYPDDYILNIYNYGIIFDNVIHWYEIGTSMPVLQTNVDTRIYENISEKHGLLIRCLNNLGFDIMSDGFRKYTANYSKRAIKEEADRREYENSRILAELAVLEMADNDRLKQFLKYAPEFDKWFNAEVEKIQVSKKDET